LARPKAAAVITNDFRRLIADCNRTISVSWVDTIVPARYFSNGVIVVTVAEVPFTVFAITSISNFCR
jgi:hypothetical protein